MQSRRRTLTVAAVTALAVLSLVLLMPGCRSRREVVLDSTAVSNQLFDRNLMPEELRLRGDEDASFVLWNRTGTQTQHVLQLARDAALKERFHRRHDMTIFGVSGRAIVPVEGKRHILEPGVAVFVPRMHAYAVIPHESPGNLIALMVYSPPFDGTETLILESQ